MRIGNTDLLMIDNVAQTTSLAASRNFKPVYLGHICNFAAQFAFTGTPDGSFKLQASNDKGYPFAQSETEQSASVTHWTDIADSNVAVIAAGDVMYNYQNCGFTWVRAVWTANTPGTAPVLTDARINVKGV